jgi:hypothetical protein
MRQPLNISKGLSLANSLIEGMEWEDVVVKSKSNRGWNPIDENGNNKPVLGQKWYKHFWKRHSHLLEKKERAQVFEGSVRVVHSSQLRPNV